MRKHHPAGRLYACLLLLICSLVLVGCQKKSDGIDTNGKPVSISDYRGKWVVINYWATWCEHCTHEMPELQTLAKKYPDKVCVLGVNFDGATLDEIHKTQKKTGITYPLLQRLSLEEYGIDPIESLPVTFIFCPQGILRATLRGPQTALKIAQLTNLVASR